MISFTVSGSTKRTEQFLRTLLRGDIFRGLESLAKEGVLALQANTPVDSGIAQHSWG